ncbi:hypothetical protein BRADI_3g05863v3 [Brachypodium distachyon]|uniref:Uncharacterized protein n=1 Tax=Brachypodium distachyon TaxID=15368 RepID=A0A2K2CVF6_BRADI|nr:hypothetical protein BRADI_3g05863v3 [Brachypodium distachyon]
MKRAFQNSSEQSKGLPELLILSLADEAILSEAVESPAVQDWFNRAAGVGDPMHSSWL